ncbi:MAG: Crp/Fnr family transcriptional regulator [Bacteroidota bacterium]|nr:Crp/Fnr family transcriptional regulator [Bacteroidota bacterium]
MDQIIKVLHDMIDISESEMQGFLSRTFTKTYRQNESLSAYSTFANEFFFINKGLVQVTFTDRDGKEHGIHFAWENQFISDYSSFLLRKPAFYNIVAVEETHVVVLSRSAIEWAYNHIRQGQKLGRLIGEFFFMSRDDRVKNLFGRTPKERFEALNEFFPQVHQRVSPQMIAAYLGISTIHLGRLKKELTRDPAAQ